MSAAPSLHFYRDLPVCTTFLDVARPEVYVDAPLDWVAVAADIRGSTEAVAAGRYRDVNLVGASVIVAVLNAVRGHDVPFVFGGDGATLLVPASFRGPVEAALRATRHMATVDFGLDLRIGCVPVADAVAAGFAVRVARVLMAVNYEQAMFTGGGLRWAEEQIKTPGTGYGLDRASPDDRADFSGLECRWRDIPSRHGETLALLVRAVDPEDLGVYRAVLEHVEEIFGGSDASRPVSLHGLQPTFSPRHLARESRVQSRSALSRAGHTLKIWAQQVLLVVFVRLDITTGTTYWPDYLRLLVETSDHRKYDDMLRLVLSATPEQNRRLEAYLEAGAVAGRLVYGLHTTDRAHMTCLVFERMGRQVHFIDAADGGYAMAARDLKRRLVARGTSRPA